jgi:hypothetical protein
MTATTGTSVGTQRYRILGCKRRNGECRGDLQLSAEKHKDDENIREQEKHGRT